MSADGKRVVQTAYNVLGFGAVLLAYLNFMMIGPYISSVFWAAILAILLRSPRDALVRVLDPLRQAETAVSVAPRLLDLPLSDGPASLPSPVVASALQSLRTPLRKLAVLARTVVLPCVATRRRQAVAAACVTVWALLVLQTLSSGAFGAFLALAAPVAVAVVLGMLLVLVPVNTLVALLLVTSLILVTLVTGGLFAARVASESAEFVATAYGRVHELLGDEAGVESSRAALHRLVGANAAASLDRVVHVASLLYAGGHNDTQGLRSAFKSLQSVLHFEDELLESLVELDYRRAVWHPFETVRLLLANSSVVLSALFRAMSDFGAQIAWTLLALSVGFVNLTFSGLLFFASLFYMVQSDSALIDRLIDVLPVAGKASYKRVVLSYIRGIFLASFWSFGLNALCTGLLFAVFGIERFRYTSMLAAGLCAMFPVVPVWLVFVPPAVTYLMQGSLLAASCFLCSGLFLSWFVAPLVYLFVPYSHPYVTGLSLVLGLYTYGLEGVLLGPLIVCLTLIVLSIFQQQHQEEQQQQQDPTTHGAVEKSE